MRNGSKCRKRRNLQNKGVYAAVTKGTYCTTCAEGVKHVYMSYDSSLSNEIASIPKKSIETLPFTTTHNESDPTKHHIKKEVRVLYLQLEVTAV
jgi:hypothetical protein